MNLITGGGLMLFFGVIVAAGTVIPVLVWILSHFILVAALVLLPLLIWRAVKLEKAEATARYIRTGL